MDPVLKQILQEYGIALHRAREDADPWAQWIRGRPTEELQLVLDNWRWPERVLQKDLVVAELEQRRRGSTSLAALLAWSKSALRRLSPAWPGRPRRPLANRRSNVPHGSGTP